MERALDEAEAALAAESDQEAREAGDQVEVPAEGPKDQGGPEEEGADETAELKNSRPGHGVLPTARPPSFSLPKAAASSYIRWHTGAQKRFQNSSIPARPPS